jgi:hypothetical protein
MHSLTLHDKLHRRLYSPLQLLPRHSFVCCATLLYAGFEVV